MEKTLNAFNAYSFILSLECMHVHLSILHMFSFFFLFLFFAYSFCFPCRMKTATLQKKNELVGFSRCMYTVFK